MMSKSTSNRQVKWLDVMSQIGLCIVRPDVCGLRRIRCLVSSVYDRLDWLSHKAINLETDINWLVALENVGV